MLTGPDPQIPTTTVVFHQRWGTLPVFGCQLRVHLSKALAIRSISGNFLARPERIDDADSDRSVGEDGSSDDNRFRCASGARSNALSKTDAAHYSPGR